MRKNTRRKPSCSYRRGLRVPVPCAVAAMFLPQARFAFTETTPPSGTELMAWGWNSGWRLGSKMFPRGAPDGLPVPEVQGDVLPLPADAPVPSPSGTRLISSALPSPSPGRAALDPATGRRPCMAGRAVAAACSLPSTTTGPARDAGRLRRARRGGTVPSLDRCGPSRGSAAGLPPGRPGRVLRKAYRLSSA